MRCVLQKYVSTEILRRSYSGYPRRPLPSVILLRATVGEGTRTPQVPTNMHSTCMYMVVMSHSSVSNLVHLGKPSNDLPVYLST